METNPFTPVSSSKLYIQIYNQLLDAILSGKYSVGDRLPSEKELCAMFSVSRVPIREALCALELNGMVATQQGSRVFVKRATLDEPNKSLDAVDPQEIIHVRTVLEPDIAREAAAHIDESERQELASIIARLHLEAKSDVYTTATDKEFHLFLARTSGITLYEIIMEQVFQAMEQKMWELILYRTVQTQKYRERNYSEHINIAQAVLDGREDDAYTFMKEHMEQLYKRYWSE